MPDRRSLSDVAIEVNPKALFLALKRVCHEYQGDQDNVGHVEWGMVGLALDWWYAAGVPEQPDTSEFARCDYLVRITLLNALEQLGVDL